MGTGWKYIRFYESPISTATPAEMKFETQSFNLTMPIIVEGKINMLLLKEIGRDSIWLKKMIGPTYAEISDVILATVDENENVRVYNLN